MRETPQSTTIRLGTSVMVVDASSMVMYRPVVPPCHQLGGASVIASLGRRSVDRHCAGRHRATARPATQSPPQRACRLGDHRLTGLRVATLTRNYAATVRNAVRVFSFGATAGRRRHAGSGARPPWHTPCASGAPFTLPSVRTAHARSACGFGGRLINSSVQSRRGSSLCGFWVTALCAQCGRRSTTPDPRTSWIGGLIVRASGNTRYRAVRCRPHRRRAT